MGPSGALEGHFPGTGGFRLVMPRARATRRASRLPPDTRRVVWPFRLNSAKPIDRMAAIASDPLTPGSVDANWCSKVRFKNSAKAATKTWALMRSTLLVQNHADDHLLAIPALILAQTVGAQCLAAFALEVDAGRIKEDHRPAREQVAPLGKQALLDQVFGAPWGERCSSALLIIRQLFAQPGHGPIELVQFEIVDPVDLVSAAPDFRATVVRTPRVGRS